jgi:hypothetical protein
MSQRVLIIGVVVSFLLILGIYTASEYFGNKRPFTKGLYRKSLSGHITFISVYKNEMTLKLSTSDSSYSFLPDPEINRIGLNFWDIVQNGDSLWKSPMSDTLHTLGKNGIEYRWLFWTHDRFGRSYLEDEND